MRLGLIARADNGGLGALTWEFFRHLAPDQTVVMDLGEAGRGRADLSRYDGPINVYRNVGTHLDDGALNLLLGCDVVYTAETAYRDDFFVRAKAAGVVTVLHAMPELYRSLHVPAHLWLPTTWEEERFRRPHQVVPVPVALDRFEDLPEPDPRTFYHVAAPAMLDRNGTQVVLAALNHITEPCTMIFVGDPRLRLPNRVGVVEVEVRHDPAVNYWEVRPPEAAALVLPRRYAGLSLPMHEAFAARCPVIAPDLAPQRDWPGVVATPLLGRGRRVPMAGGSFEVHRPDPRGVAAAIDDLVRHPEKLALLSRSARVHAETISWHTWKPIYLRLLEEAAVGSNPIRTT